MERYSRTICGWQTMVDISNELMGYQGVNWLVRIPMVCNIAGLLKPKYVQLKKSEINLIQSQAASKMKWNF